MKFSSRPIFAVALCLALCFPLAGCKRFRSQPPLAVKSAAEGRSLALGLALLPNLDRSLDRIAGIAEAINVPFDGKESRSRMLAAIKVPAALSTTLSGNLPVTVAFLPPEVPGHDPETTAAFQLQDESTAKGLLAALGQPIATKDDASSFKQEDGSSIWVWRKNNNLVLSTSLPTLVSGASLAVDYLRQPQEDLVLTINPVAIAKSHGTDVKTALSTFMTEMESAGSLDGETPLGLALGTHVIKAIGDRIADLEEVQLTVGIDASRGASLSLKLTPKPGSTFANNRAKAVPYEIEPATLSQTDPFLVATSSSSTLLADTWHALAPTLAASPETAPLAKSFDSIFTSLTGAFSIAASSNGKEWQQVGVCQLASGTSPDSYLDQIMALYKGPALVRFLAALGVEGKLTMARDKNLLAGEWKLSPGKLPPKQALAMKSMFGDKYQFALAAQVGRILVATGPQARTQVKNLAAQKPTPKPIPAEDLATATQETSTADALLFVDLMQALRLAFSASPMGSAFAHIPTMSALRMPLWLSYRDGSAPTVDFRIPMNTLRSIGNLLPILSMLGGMGGR